MYQVIQNASRFRDAFRAYDREHQFSYAGFDALFEWLEENGYEELDVIALCCEYTEYEPDELVSAYGYAVQFEEDASKDEKFDAVFEYVAEQTVVVLTTSGTYIIQEF
jgi:hypothetical protein